MLNRGNSGNDLSVHKCFIFKNDRLYIGGVSKFVEL